MQFRSGVLVDLSQGIAPPYFQTELRQIPCPTEMRKTNEENGELASEIRAPQELLSLLQPLQQILQIRAGTEPSSTYFFSS